METEMTKWFLLAYVLISILLFDPKPFLGGDNAVYVILAESIVQGKGYRDLHIVGEPPHTTYPPGMALLFAPFVAVFGRNLILLKFVIVLVGLAGYWFFLKITQGISPPFVSKYASCLYLATPPLILYNHWCLSEIPYLTASLGAIWFVLKGEKE